MGLEITSGIPKASLAILPAPVDQQSAIVTFLAMAMPMFYLAYHGWASKNLLDTEWTDRLALSFFKWSMFFATACLLLPRMFK